MTYNKEHSSQPRAEGRCFAPGAAGMPFTFLNIIDQLVNDLPAGRKEQDCITKQKGDHRYGAAMGRQVYKGNR